MLQPHRFPRHFRRAVGKIAERPIAFGQFVLHLLTGQVGNIVAVGKFLADVAQAVVLTAKPHKQDKRGIGVARNRAEQFPQVCRILPQLGTSPRMGQGIDAIQ